MGTNYYAVVQCDDPCAHCSPSRLHIGKSSGGWAFCFQGYPDKHLTSKFEWLIYLANEYVLIQDEYGSQLSLEEFNDVVERKGFQAPNREKVMMPTYQPFHSDGFLCHVDPQYPGSYHDKDGYDVSNSDFS